jgi:hypothetical protein
LDRLSYYRRMRYKGSVVRIFGFLGVLLFAAGTALGEEGLSPEHAAELAAVRMYALDYTQHLPDYTCTQVTKRRTEPAFHHASVAVIEEQLTFSNQKESYQVLKFNGERAIGVEHDQMTGVMTGEFGTLLHRIFDPRSGATIVFNGMDKAQGRRMIVFGYQVPQDAGMILHAERPQRMISTAIKGQVRVDAESKQVLQITMLSVGLPRDFPTREVRLVLEYKSVPVAGREYMLPFHSELYTRNITTSVKSEIEYTQYRKFVSDATLKFDGDDSAKQ